MADCLITGTALDVQGLPKAGVNVYVYKTPLSGGVTHKVPKLVATSDADGLISFVLPQSSIAYIGGQFLVNGTDFSPSGGIALSIPAASSATLVGLAPPSFPITEEALQAYTGIYTEIITEDTELEDFTGTRAVILIDSSDGDRTATLPPISEMANKTITLKKIADENLGIVDGFEDELIDGALVYNLEMNNEFIEVVPVDGAWYVIGKG